MTNYLTTDTELTSVANAIRTKGGTQATLSWPSGFVSAIGNISSGSQILDGYTCVDFDPDDGGYIDSVADFYAMVDVTVLNQDSGNTDRIVLFGKYDANFVPYPVYFSINNICTPVNPNGLSINDQSVWMFEVYDLVTGDMLGYDIDTVHAVTVAYK